MHTGQYYYDQMPAAVQRKFLLNIERSKLYTIEEVMRSEYMSHKLFILCPFHQFDSPEGKFYWHCIADENYSVEPEGRFVTWVNRNTLPIAIGFTLLSIVLCFMIALLINKHHEESKQKEEEYRQELSRRDSIIHAAAHIDSIKTNMIGQRPSFDEMRKGWEPKGVMMESKEEFMDSNPLKQ